MRPFEAVILRLGRFTCHRSKETHFVLILEGRRAPYRYATCPECHVEHEWEFVIDESVLPLKQAGFVCGGCKTVNRIHFVQSGSFQSRCSGCGSFNEVEG